MNISLSASTRYYILVGDEVTWKISLENKIWGFNEKTKGLWNKSNIGDYLAFYVILPIRKIIGFGRIKEKYIDESLIWYDEKIFNRSLWKYRISFDGQYTIKDWGNGIEVPHDIILNTGRKVVKEYTFKKLIANAEKKWNVNITNLLTLK